MHETETREPGFSRRGKISRVRANAQHSPPGQTDIWSTTSISCPCPLAVRGPPGGPRTEGSCNKPGPGEAVKQPCECLSLTLLAPFGPSGPAPRLLQLGCRLPHAGLRAPGPQESLRTCVRAGGDLQGPHGRGDLESKWCCRRPTASRPDLGEGGREEGRLATCQGPWGTLQPELAPGKPMSLRQGLQTLHAVLSL